MKSLKTILSLGLLVCLFLNSCATNPEKGIAKSWRLTEIKTESDMSDQLKSQMLAGSQMTFTDDGNYFSTGGIGVDQGTYTIDEDGNNLSTISSAGKNNSVYKVEKLTDDKLVLNNNGSVLTFAAN